MSAGQECRVGRRGACLVGCLALVWLLAGPATEASATALPATISSDQTWTVAGSPYTGSDVTISPGTTVTVEPAAVIKLSGSLTANGILDAEGTSADPITFTSAQDSGSPGWSGVRLNTSGSTVEHATLRHSTQDAAISVGSGSSPSISNSRITQSLHGVSVLAGGAPEISHNEITDINGYAVHYSSTGAPGGSEINIHDNEIRRTGVAASGAAIYISVLSSAVSGASFGDNVIDDNDGMAVSYRGDSNSALPSDIGENTLTGNEKNAIFLSGRVAANATWSAGTYVIDQWDLTVATGATLSLEPGVVVKGVNGTSNPGADGKITAYGSLDARGTAPAPVVFTSLSDDTAGGDTNGDGATSASVWSGVELHSSGSILDGVQVRNSRYAAVAVNDGASPTISNSSLSSSTTGIAVNGGGAPEIADNLVHDTSGSGIYYNAPGTSAPPGSQVRIHGNEVSQTNASGAGAILVNAGPNVAGTTLAGNEVTDNSGMAIYYGGSSDAALPSDISDNLISGNGRNGIFLSGKIGTDSTWGGGPFVIQGADVTIPAGRTLLLEPGTVVKAVTGTWSSGGELVANGKLDAQGTAADPIVFTKLGDDSVGGDSGDDAASSRWAGIALNSSSSVVDHAHVRYARYGAITVNGGASPTISNSTLSHSQHGVSVPAGGAAEISGNAVSEMTGAGIFYNGGGAPAGSQVKIHGNEVRDTNGGINVTGLGANVTGVTLSENVVEDNLGRAISFDGGSTTILPPDISDNSIDDNEKNAIFLSGKLASDSTWGGGPFVVQGPDVTIPSGRKLTIQPGSVVKALTGGSPNSDGEIVANGDLDAQGTSADPIVFTRIADDSVGGDTNNDGPTSSGRWRGINLYTSASILDHVDVRHSAYGAVTLNGGISPSITNSVFRDSNRGIQVNGGGAPEIAHNLVRDNAYGITYSGSGAAAGSQVRIHDNDVLRSSGTSGAGIHISNPGTNVVGVTLADNLVADGAGKAIVYEGASSSVLPPDISDSTIAGNAMNGIFLSGKVAADAVWGGGPFVIRRDQELGIPAGSELTIQPGTVFKGEYNSKISITGKLDAVGTKAAPITFTSIQDDSVGGDTDGDGEFTPPGAWDWRGIDFLSGSEYGTIGNATVTRADVGVQIYCPCPTPPTLSHSRVAFTGIGGIMIGSNPGATALGEPMVSWMTFRQTGNLAIDKAGAPEMQSPYNDYGCSSGPRPEGCGEPVGQYIDPWPAGVTKSEEGPCQGGGNSCGLGADPIVMATGAFTYAHNDLRLGGLDRPLIFARTYNSSDSTDSGLGEGWASVALIRAAALANGDVVVAWDDGKQETYELQPGGGYTSPAGAYSELSKTSAGYTLVRESGSASRRTFEFDRTGRVVSMNDANRNETTYDYNANGRLTSITDPSGQQLHFAYDTSNHISSVTDSTGRTVSFGYTDGRLTSATDPLNKTTTYGYDANGRLDAITDPRGSRFVDNDYDSQGRVTTQTDAEGNEWSVDYLPGETRVFPPEGGVQVQEFDAENRLVAKTDEVGSRTAFSYDSEGNISEIVRPGGATWTLGYADRKIESISGPGGATESYAYNSQRLPSSYTDARGETWEYEYSPERDLTKVTDPLNNETTFTYRADGRLQTVTDANGNTKTFGYDALGNLTSVEDALGHTTTFSFNARSELTGIDEPGKAEATIDRDAMGRIIATETPEGEETTYGYDTNGALTTTTDPGNHEWRIERNAMDLPTAYVDPLGNRTEIDYDGNLRVSSVTDRRGETTSYGYDHANHLTGVSLPGGSEWSFAYNTHGMVASAEDPLGNETTFGYDLRRQLTRITQELGVETRFEYNGAGDLLELTDPAGNVTDYDYDELGRLTELAEPLGKTTTYSYDDVGNLLEEQDPVNALQYSYDDADRLTAVAEGPSLLREFVYDNADRLTEATDAQGDAIELGYDDDDLITSIDDGRGMEATLTYNARSLLASETDARGTITYGYDELGRLEHLNDPSPAQTDYGYDDEGNLKTVDLPNGVETTNTYDALGRLERTKSKLGTTTLQEFTYGFDLAGNRVSEEDRNGDVSTYGYDELNRLVELDPPSGPAVPYGYDERGNRTLAGSTTYDYDELNRLESSSDGRAYSYDGAGRLTQVASSALRTGYSYDALDQLTTITRTDPSATTIYPQIDLESDALGRQAQRTAGTGLLTSHYPGVDSRPGYETDGGSAPSRQYFYGAEGLTSTTAGSGQAFPLADAGGDLLTMTDASGSVLSRQDFDPFGVQTSGSSSRLGYGGASGARTDTETGLVGNGGSPYDPGTATYPTGGLASPGASPYAGGAGGLDGATSPTALLDALAAAQRALNAAPTRPGMGAAYAEAIAATSPQVKTSACSASGDAGLLETLGHAFVGYMDSYSGGLTQDVRQLVGIDGVDYCSPYYASLAALGQIPVGPGSAVRAGVKGASLARRVVSGLADGSGRRMSGDQRAIRDLVDEATNQGRRPMAREDAETILDWAEEAGYPGVRAKHGDVASPSNWGANPVPHIHVPGSGRGGHVPVEPGVRPR